MKRLNEFGVVEILASSPRSLVTGARDSWPSHAVFASVFGVNSAASGAACPTLFFELKGFEPFYYYYFGFTTGARAVEIAEAGRNFVRDSRPAFGIWFNAFCRPFLLAKVPLADNDSFLDSH